MRRWRQHLPCLQTLPIPRADFHNRPQLRFVRAMAHRIAPDPHDLADRSAAKLARKTFRGAGVKTALADIAKLYGIGAILPSRRPRPIDRCGVATPRGPGPCPCWGNSVVPDCARARPAVLYMLRIRIGNDAIQTAIAYPEVARAYRGGAALPPPGGLCGFDLILGRCARR